MTATTGPLVPEFTSADAYRLCEIADLLAAAMVGDKVTVRIAGPAELDACVACDPEPMSGERVAGDVTVHWGYSRPCYADPVCRGCLARFLRIHIRHDQARPRVDIPAVVAL